MNDKQPVNPGRDVAGQSLDAKNKNKVAGGCAIPLPAAQ